MKNLAILSILLISSCSINKLVTPITINDQTNSYVELTYDKSKAAGLQLLQEKPIQKGSKEIRIWVGFGLETPEELVILQVDNKNVVTGKKMYLFDKDPERWEDQESDLNFMLKNMSFYCSAHNTYKHYKSCIQKTNKYYDWKKIYKHLINLDIWNLPDQSKLPKSDIFSTGGLSIVVELRSDENYRAYSYWNPEIRVQKEAKQAYQIMSLIRIL